MAFNDRTRAIKTLASSRVFPGLEISTALDDSPKHIHARLLIAPPSRNATVSESKSVAKSLQSKPAERRLGRPVDGRSRRQADISERVVEVAFGRISRLRRSSCERPESAAKPPFRWDLETNSALESPLPAAD